MADNKNVPYILIVTSKEEKKLISNQIKEYFDKTKSHYVIVMNEDNYLSNKKFGFVGKLFNRPKSLKTLKRNCKNTSEKKSKGQLKRIVNGIKRFNPTCIVCPTVYGLLSAVEAKNESLLSVPIISVIPNFTLDKTSVVRGVDYYIVENAEIKEELISEGVTSDDILPMGVAVNVEEIDSEKKAEIKEKLGLKDVPTVFVYVKSSKESLEAIDMLFDQGDIINIVAYVEDKSLLNNLRKLVEIKSCDNVQMFDKLSLYNDYLSVSDILITNYDAGTIYKAFMAKSAVIAFAPTGQVEKNDIEYLDKQRLIAYAQSPQDVILKLYDLLQTDLLSELVNNTNERVQPMQLNNICEFLASLK